MMATIDMSPDLSLNFNYTFMDNGNNTGYATAYATGGVPLRGMLCMHAQSDGEIGGRFLLMQGAVPTIADLLPGAPMALSVGARAADILVKWDSTYWSSTNSANDFGQSRTNVNPIILSSLYVNASQAGTATWFWWFNQRFAGGSAYVNDALHPPISSIIGTVGGAGSGADLELPSTAITLGQPVRVYNFRLQTPTSWTY
jgi:hypothetical protein